MNTSPAVTLEAPKPITISRNIKMLCVQCQEVNPVIDVEHSLFADPVAVLSCNHRRGAGLPKGPGLIGLEDLVVHIDPLTDQPYPPTANQLLAQKLFPLEEGWTRIDEYQPILNRKQRAKQASLQAKADALLSAHGEGALVEQSREFAEPDEDIDGDFDGGYQFSGPERVNYDEFEGGNWSSRRPADVSFDSADEFDPSDAE
jgi:hypothetical protein